MSEFEVSRRNLICGLAAGAAVPLLAACGGGADPVVSGPTGTATTAGPSGSGGAAGAIKTSEIPVGGGKIFADRSMIVTQPKAGEFKAFTTQCTHQGTAINRIEGTDMVCPNHGSRFSIVDGSVDQGPASVSLPEKTVDVSGDTLTVSG